MLEANPNLTWRDVQHILATTAVKNGAQDSDWTLNGAGYHVNHKYLGVQLKSGQLSREGIQYRNQESVKTWILSLVSYILAPRKIFSFNQLYVDSP